MYSPHKHSYLQARSSGIPPRIINRAVNAANENIAIDEYDQEPPYNRLTSEQPCIPIENVDVTRRPVAFGRLAMPKLRRELHSADPFVVMQAINSIGDLVHDPERGYEAIELRVPDRMADLLLNEDPGVRERVCMALKTMAGLGDGKEAIVANQFLLDNLKNLLRDESGPVRIKNAALLEMISRTWMYGDILVDNDFIPAILSVLMGEEEPIMVIHLETLGALMYCHGKDQALDLGAFDFFVELLDHSNEDIVANAAHCLMVVTSTITGKKMAFKKNIVFRLTQLLKHSNAKIYAAAASAIMFSTIKTRAKIKAMQIKHLPDRLVNICKDWSNPDAQLFGMKALTNVSEHPKIKLYVYENYLEEIKNINIRDNPQFKPAKDVLIDIVTRVPALY